MNKVDKLASLIEIKWKLQASYNEQREAVQKRYPTHPPQTEVHKYTAIKQRITKLSREIERISKETI